MIAIPNTVPLASEELAAISPAEASILRRDVAGAPDAEARERGFRSVVRRLLRCPIEQPGVVRPGSVDWTRSQMLAALAAKSGAA